MYGYSYTYMNNMRIYMNVSRQTVAQGGKGFTTADIQHAAQ